MASAKPAFLPSTTLPIPLLNSSTSSSSQVSLSPNCSLPPLSRRSFINLIPPSLAAALLPSPTFSESLNAARARYNVSKVTLAVAKAKALVPIVTSWNSSLEEDDYLYIIRFIPVWLEPAKDAMRNVATQEGVDVGDRNVLENQATTMFGHLLELKMEAKERKKDGVLRELDEFVETADQFLAEPGVKPFI